MTDERSPIEEARDLGDAELARYSERFHRLADPRTTGDTIIMPAIALLPVEANVNLKELLANALYNEEAHYKQWYLWKIVEALHLDLSDQWDDEYPEPWKGIAP